jgi:hypothetical protein
MTSIYTPWIFTTSESCGDLIAGIPDYYKPIYLSECQRRMGLAEEPFSVPRADVIECYDMGNGTVKYRSEVCCSGKRTQPAIAFYFISFVGTLSSPPRCFVCAADTPIDYDAQQRRWHTYECNYFRSVERCPAGQVTYTLSTIYNVL